MHSTVVGKDRVVRELCAKKFSNDAGTAVRRANETWDGWVAAEVARETLQPEHVPPIDWQRSPPPWAKPFGIGKERGIDTSSKSRPSHWERLRKINRGPETAE